MKVPGAVRIDASRLALLAPYRAPFLPPPSSSPRTAAQPSATGSSRPPIAIPIPKKKPRVPTHRRDRCESNPTHVEGKGLVRSGLACDARAGARCRMWRRVCVRAVCYMFEVDYVDFFFSLCLGEKDRPFFASNFVLL